MTDGTILDFLAHGPAESADVRQVAFRQGQKATHESGLLYMGPWEMLADGFAEHTRRSVRALAGTGVPLQLRSFSQDAAAAQAQNDEVVAMEETMRPMLRASIGRYEAMIYQLVPWDSLLQFLTTHQHYTTAELAVLNASRALYTVWERDRISVAARSALNRVAQAWVACQANADMLAENGVRPEAIRVIPCPFFPDDPHIALRDRVRHRGRPRFYHIGKWEPRKAQDRIILAFMRAFRPGEAMLIMKVSPLGPQAKVDPYPRDYGAAVRAALEHPEVKANGWTLTSVAGKHSLLFITERLPAAKIVELHAAGDVYVSMSRGEGFDMPALDAKLAGNSMVYTPSGGTQAFAGPEDECVPKTGRVLCHPFYKWNTDAGYIDYDVDEAVQAMRRAAAGFLRTTRGGLSSLDFCSAAVVGAKMRQCVEEVIANTKRVSDSFARSLREQQSATVHASTEAVPYRARVVVATHGIGVEAPYGGARVNALFAEVVKRHPAVGDVEVVAHGMVPDQQVDVAFVEIPTGQPYLDRVQAKQTALLRYGDDGHGACAFQVFEREDPRTTVVVPTEYAARTLSYRIPYRVVYNAFEPPEEVRRGGRRGNKVLFTGAFRFAKDTPLAAAVACNLPDVSFVWRKSTEFHQALAPIPVPENVELLDPTPDRDELWQDVGCVLVPSRFESFCLIAYEAMCRGVPVVFQSSLGSIPEWAGIPPGLFMANNATNLAGCVSAALDAVTKKEDPYAKLAAIAQSVHEQSLRQANALIDELVQAAGGPKP